MDRLGRTVVPENLLINCRRRCCQDHGREDNCEEEKEGGGAHEERYSQILFLTIETLKGQYGETCVIVGKCRWKQRKFGSLDRPRPGIMTASFQPACKSSQARYDCAEVSHWNLAQPSRNMTE